MANKAAWRHFYLKRGKYKDGRERIVIAWWENGKRKIKSLPEPEKLKQILSEPFKGALKSTKFNKEKS